jgi:hypothetical protein
LFSASQVLHESAVACVTAVSFGQGLSPTFGQENPAAPSSSSPQPALVARTKEETTNEARRRFFGLTGAIMHKMKNGARDASAVFGSGVD